MTLEKSSLSIAPPTPILATSRPVIKTKTTTNNNSNNNVGGINLPSADVLKSPERWSECWKELQEKSITNKNKIALFCDTTSPLNSNVCKARIMCPVRVLPRLNDIKIALRKFTSFREHRRASTQRIGGPLSLHNFSVNEKQNNCIPNPTIWAVDDNSIEGGITIIDAILGITLMSIIEPKLGVNVTSLMHAPFRGLIDRRLQIIPIEEPHEIINIREASLINTDYVWVGFADGAIRLFPSNPQRVREQDRSVLLSKGEIADLVYELPKYHSSSIIAITRSPCHEDDKTTDLVTNKRLSNSIYELTAATSRFVQEDRQHLALVCTASEDSCIVVWDLQKIYREIENLRLASLNAKSSPAGLDTSNFSLRGDVVTFDVKSYLGLSSCKVRSTCTMIKIRPLFKLKGDLGGLRTLKWISTVVTTVNYEKKRDVVAMTRDPKESTASELIKNRRIVQQKTRWDKREEDRVMLRFSELEMQDVEKELEILMPPLTPEPPQRKRINLIIAGDVHGRVHIWDLDEELNRNIDTINSVTSSPRTRCSSRGSSRGESPLRTFDFSVSPRRNRTGTSTLLTTSSILQSQSETETVNTHEIKSIKASSFGTIEKSRKNNKNEEELISNVPSTPKLRRTTRKYGKLKTPTGSLASETPLRSSVKNSVAKKPLIRPIKQSGKVQEGRGTPMSLKSSNNLSNCDNISESAVRRQSKTSISTQRIGNSARKIVRTPRSSEITIKSSLNKRSKSEEKKKLDSLFSSRNPRRNTLKSTENDSIEYNGSDSTRDNASNSVSKRVRNKISGVNSTRQSFRQSNPLSGIANTSTTGNVSIASISATSDTWTLRWETNKTLTSPLKILSSLRSYSGRFSTHANTLSQRSLLGGDQEQQEQQQQKNREEWKSEHQYLNNIYSRKARCRLNITDGATVSGIEVDFPPIITVTMRRLPDPPEEQYSLLETPTDEEIRRRKLANSFYPLTDERALFCAFSKLQLYVSVEGTVMNMQCTPKAREDNFGSVRHLLRTNEDKVIEETDSFGFNIMFRRQILERHSQPVVLLFNDHLRHHLWVARNDGLISIFSTETKSIITRIPHPSADNALGPPSLTKWMRTQREMALMEKQPIHLKKHKECKKYPPAHFIDLKGISVFQQFELLLTSSLRDIDSIKEFIGLTSEFSPETCITHIDCRDLLDEHARGRESSLNGLLEILKKCRQNAVAVRLAQRDYYILLFNNAANRINSIMIQYTKLSALFAARKAFKYWIHHRDYFSRCYILRNMRQKRFIKLSQASNIAANNNLMRIRRIYFTNWILAIRTRLINRIEHYFSNIIRPRVNSPIPTKIISFLAEYTRLKEFYLQWKSILAPPLRIPSHSPPNQKSKSPSNNTLAATQIFSPQTPRIRSLSRSKGNSREGIFVDLHAIIRQIYSIRQEFIKFRWNEVADSVLDIDEFWLDVVEGAASEAENKTSYSIKLAVFKFGLLPLLEGLLSSAHDALPHINQMPISDAARSLIRGCLLCVDCIYADNENITDSVTVNTLISNDNNNNSSSSSVINPSDKEMIVSFKKTPLYKEKEVRELFNDTMNDPEHQSQIESITGNRAVISEFLHFCTL